MMKRFIMNTLALLTCSSFSYLVKADHNDELGIEVEIGQKSKFANESYVAHSLSFILPVTSIEASKVHLILGVSQNAVRLGSKSLGMEIEKRIFSWSL